MNSEAKAWLNDAIHVVGLSCAAAVLLSLLLMLGMEFSDEAYGIPPEVRQLVFAFEVPFIITGFALGAVAASVIAHPRLWIVLLPTALVCGLGILLVISVPLSEESALKWSANWLLLALASFLTARIVLWRRFAKPRP